MTSNQGLRSTLRRACSRSLLGATLAATLFPAAAGAVPAGNAPVNTVVSVANPAVPAADVATTTAPQRSGRVPDGLADMAAFTLEALRANAGGSLAAAGPVLAPPTPQNFTATSAPSTTRLVLEQSQQGTWASAIVETADLLSVLNGAQAVNPASSARVQLPVASADPSSRYPAALAQLANMVSTRVKGASASNLLQVWLATDATRMTVILTAMAQVGTYYRYTGNQPGGFDCSGLTSYSWSMAGVRIPRVSGDQINAAAPRALADMKPGDLVYRPGHIGLYLGVADAMVHSPQTGKPVAVVAMGRVTRMGSPIG